MINPIAVQQAGQAPPQQQQQQQSQQPHPYAISKIEPPGADKKEKVPEHLKGEIFPGFPTTTVMVGQPGSGKTNLLISMLSGERFYKGFFDKVYLFGLTCKSDDLYKAISVPKDQIITEAKDIVPRLATIINEQQEAVENDWNSAEKLLFIFEDMTSLFARVQQSEEFVRCYTQIRHLKGSSIAMVHKYKAFNRTCRMASLHLICFKVNHTDIVQLHDDFGSSYVTLNEFMEIADFALKKESKEDHPFFYINLQAPEEDRFRRNFTTILRIDPNRKYTQLGRGKRKFDDIQQIEENEDGTQTELPPQEEEGQDQTEQEPAFKVQAKRERGRESIKESSKRKKSKIVQKRKRK